MNFTGALPPPHEHKVGDRWTLKTGEAVEVVRVVGGVVTLRTTTGDVELELDESKAHKEEAR